uniref:Polyadenylate-binding protein, cytoplasmic and nuclear n=1 Tax=Cacopsylla melanoneura TaxID=428564 RepID=A0A8D9B1G0_9HEMI
MMHNMAENLGQASNKKYNTDTSHSILTDIFNFSRPTTTTTTSSGSGSVCSDGGGDIPIKNRRNLYVANLDNDITENQLRIKFLRFGKIVSVHIITGRANLPGCGFVNFSSHEEAQAAVDSLNGSIWNGKKIKVDFAFKKNTGGKSGAAPPPNGPTLVKPAPPIGGGKSMASSSAPNGVKPPTTAGGSKITTAGGPSAGGNSLNVSSNSTAKASQQQCWLKTNNFNSNLPLNGQSLVKSDPKPPPCLNVITNSNNISLTKTGGASLSGQQSSKKNMPPNNNNSNGPFSGKVGANDAAAAAVSVVNKTPKDFGTPLNGGGSLSNAAANGTITAHAATKQTNKTDRKDIIVNESDEEDDGYEESESNDGDKQVHKKDSDKRKNRGVDKTREYNDENIEHILCQVEDAIRNVFEKGKVAQINTLRRQMEIELSNNFSEPESYRIIDHLLDKVEETITTFVILDGNELLRSPVDKLKESIREWYGRDNGRIMRQIEQLRVNLKLFGVEENKKAKLVTQLFLIETYLDKFLNKGLHIQIGLLERGVRKIERAKILFLTESMRSDRVDRLDQIKTSLKSLTIHDDAKGLIKAVYEELKEAVKNAYVGFPMRPKLGKKVRTQLTRLRSDLAEFATEAETKQQLTYELNAMELEIGKHNRDGLSKFLAEHQKTLKDQLAAKGRYDDEIFDPEFWKDIEKFLLESCLEGTPERATSSTAKDATGGVNLYVNNLHPQLDSLRLEREFARFGTIVSARVFPQSKKLYGTAVVSSGPNTKLYGFVKYASPASAVRAMEEMNGEHLMGREVEVSVATNTENLKTYFKFLLGRTM